MDVSGMSRLPERDVEAAHSNNRDKHLGKQRDGKKGRVVGLKAVTAPPGEL